MEIPRKRKKIIGCIAGVLTILFIVLSRLFPGAVETVYVGYVFPAIRFTFDHTLSLIPLPWVYVLAAWIIFRIIRSFVRQRRELRGAGLWMKFKSGGLSVLGFLGWSLFAFYFLWGFNYSRPDLGKKVSFLKDETEAGFIMEAYSALFDVNEDRDKMGLDSLDTLTDHHIPDTILIHMRRQVKIAMEKLGIPAYGNPVVKYLYPEEVLGSFCASGVYIPFTGEAYVEGKLPPLSRPFIIAHELSHAFGIASELDANFIAWLACRNSSLPVVRYSGDMEFLDQSRRDLKFSDSLRGAEFTKNLPPGIAKDFHNRNQGFESHHTFLSRLNLHGNVFNAFLKTQGQKLGIKGYGMFSSYVRQWKKIKESQPEVYQLTP